MPKSKANTTGIMHASLRPAIAELERGIEWAADRAGIKGLPKITVTIQTSGKRRACNATFTPEMWSSREGEMSSEINFDANQLIRTPLEIMETVVHETQHLLNFSLLKVDHDGKQKPDCAKSGRHNKIFKENAELAGLIVADASDSYGWGHTSLGENLHHAIETDFVPDAAALDLFRIVLPKKETQPTKMIKWECETQCASFRTAKVVNVQCLDCDTPFTRAEVEEKFQIVV